MTASTQDQPHRATFRKWWILIAVGIVLFLGSVDGSIVNVALPTLMSDFNADFPTVQWVVLAYLLGLTVLLVSMGRLADMLGKKRVFASGIVLFLARLGPVRAGARCLLADRLSFPAVDWRGHDAGAWRRHPDRDLAGARAWPGHRLCGRFHLDGDRFRPCDWRRDAAISQLALDLLCQRADRRRGVGVGAASMCRRCAPRAGVSLLTLAVRLR